MGEEKQLLQEIKEKITPSLITSSVPAGNNSRPQSEQESVPDKAAEKTNGSVQSVCGLSWHKDNTMYHGSARIPSI